MSRKINYKSIGIVIVCILAIIITIGVYFKSALKCQITDINIHELLEYPGGTTTADDFLKGFSGDFGLNNEMQKDIRLDPQKYKIVNIKFNTSNILKLIGLYDIGINAKYDSNLSKMIVGKIDTTQSDDSPLIIGFKENSHARFMFIIKVDNENSEEILQYVQRSNFILKCTINGLNKQHVDINIGSKK
ncbi:hypothetical protein [Clostridium saccharobutylicum]|uniref:Uncharacterized protein n=1 Tax=Clostridium saccharobutylicum TaxID=169679 RepID=A0A1S8NC73_CLOSA|nr:hypothetical protein [Clostridium saccharobutylicum]OOM13973.1 hypothetical protein CLOSAC_20590 [Clostridium saccharobutylicum]